ncbi:hypothetical protein PROPEN_02348 [Proteus penneri ATCC 35198]|nr:hypothetical protein PROPEN_02348 [Proteus penneri ATCC 35198]
MRTRIREYNQRPTDHGTLPRNSLFLRRVVTYDLPIGYCEIGRSPEKMDELRKYADWLSGLDGYMEKGVLDIPEMPEIIKKSHKRKNINYLKITLNKSAQLKGISHVIASY